MEGSMDTSWQVKKAASNAEFEAALAPYKIEADLCRETTSPALLGLALYELPKRLSTDRGHFPALSYSALRL